MVLPTRFSVVSRSAFLAKMVVLLLLGIFILPRMNYLPSAQAQEQTSDNTSLAPLSLSISPTVVEMAIQPGKVVTQAFLIENNGTVDLEIRPTLRDFRADGETGLPVLLPDSSFPYAKLVNSEIQLNQPFTIPAGKSEQLVLEISPSELAETRDWYVTLLLETKPDTRYTVLQNSGSATTGEIGAHVLVRVTQTNQEPLSWDIRLELPRFMDSLQKIEFVPLVSNQSQSMAIPDMSITILRGDNTIVSEQEALPDRILAQSSRRIYAKQVRKDDPRSFEGIPFSFTPTFAFGKYTIRASIRNNANGPLVVEREIWAFPFSLLIGAAGVLMLLLVFHLWRSRKEEGQARPE